MLRGPFSGISLAPEESPGRQTNHRTILLDHFEVFLSQRTATDFLDFFDFLVAGLRSDFTQPAAASGRESPRESSRESPHYKNISSFPKTKK